MSKIVIDSTRKTININWKELIEYKDLFITLAYRDFKVRYSQTFLGFLWAIVQPVTSLILFTIVFGHTINVDTKGVEYPLFAMSGMCAWTYFSVVINQSGGSLIASQGMIQKIYFPRLVIPLSKAVSGFIDLGIALVLLFVLMVAYNVKPGLSMLLLPVFIIITIITSLAVGIWISALTIRYRDFQTVVPYLLQLGFYATPIAYPTSSIKDKYEILFYLNPMTGVTQGFRWCILGVDPPDTICYISFLGVLLLFLSGLFYFRKIERIMSDII